MSPDSHWHYHAHRMASHPAFHHAPDSSHSINRHHHAHRTCAILSRDSHAHRTHRYFMIHTIIHSLLAPDTFAIIVYFLFLTHSHCTGYIPSYPNITFYTYTGSPLIHPPTSAPDLSFILEYRQVFSWTGTAHLHHITAHRYSYLIQHSSTAPVLLTLSIIFTPHFFFSLSISISHSLYPPPCYTGTLCIPTFTLSAHTLLFLYDTQLFYLFLMIQYSCLHCLLYMD